MELFKKTSHISGGKFPNSKVKKKHSEKISWNFLATSLRNSYVSGGNLESLKNRNFLYFHKNVFPTFLLMTADEVVNQKTNCILCLL